MSELHSIELKSRGQKFLLQKFSSLDFESQLKQLREIHSKMKDNETYELSEKTKSSEESNP